MKTLLSPLVDFLLLVTLLVWTAFEVVVLGRRTTGEIDGED